MGSVSFNNKVADTDITFCRSSVIFDRQIAESPATLRRTFSFLDDDDQDPWECFLELIDKAISASGMPTTIYMPLLPGGIATVLELLVDEGMEEQSVITVFLNYLAGTAAGNRLSKQAKRLIAKAYKNMKADRLLVDAIEDRLTIEIGELEVVDEFSIPTFLRK